MPQVGRWPPAPITVRMLGSRRVLSSTTYLPLFVQTDSTRLDDADKTPRQPHPTAHPQPAASPLARSACPAHDGFVARRLPGSGRRPHRRHKHSPFLREPYVPARGRASPQRSGRAVRPPGRRDRCRPGLPTCGLTPTRKALRPEHHRTCFIHLFQELQPCDAKPSPLLKCSW